MPKVILSTDDNDHYLFFAPIISFVWLRMGFHPFIMMMNSETPKSQYVISKLPAGVMDLKPIDGYRNSTVVQASRLYWPRTSEDYCLISDIDMLPLNRDYFYRDFDKVNVFGADLLGFKQYPMCYIGMTGDKWQEVMQYKGDIQGNIENDLKANLSPNNDNFDQYWFYDQELITKKINASKLPINHIHRGYRGSYPIGRIDRGDWEGTKNQPNCIDAHLLRVGYHPEYFDKMMELVKMLLPKENLKWMYDYAEGYREIIK